MNFKTDLTFLNGRNTHEKEANENDNEENHKQKIIKKRKKRIL